MAKKFFVGMFIAVWLLGACSPQKNSPAAEPVAENRETQEDSLLRQTRTPGDSLRTKLEEAEKQAGMEEPEASSEADSREEEKDAGEEQPELQFPENLSGENEEQTAVYTQGYSENGLYFVDCVRLYARGDSLYRLEEQLELYLRHEELGMVVEPGELEEMLDMVEELFQGMMDEYGESEGVSTKLRRQDSQYLMDIVCEVTEETAQGIVDLGFLDIEDTWELLSFQKMCEMLEEENYTKAK